MSAQLNIMLSEPINTNHEFRFRKHQIPKKIHSKKNDTLVILLFLCSMYAEKAIATIEVGTCAYRSRSTEIWSAT